MKGVVLLTVVLLLLVIIVQAEPPSPHSVSGWILIPNGSQVPLYTDFIVYNINDSVYIQDQTNIPAPGYSGRYSVSIQAEDGDLGYTKSWNSTNWGITNYTYMGDLTTLNGTNVTLNMSRIEQNLSIIYPLNDSTLYTGLFNVTVNITAIGADDNKQCNATLSFNNPSVLALANGETAQHDFPTLYTGTTIQANWTLNATDVGKTNISVNVTCFNETYFYNFNNDTAYNITFEISYPFIDSIVFDDITLNPGITKTVNCSGQVNDTEGYDTLSVVRGEIFSSNSVAGASQNNSKHYKDSDCSTVDLNVNGTYYCEFDVYFFAEPGTWTCYINVTDNLGNTNSSTNTSTLNSLLAVDIAEAIVDFGSMAKGEDTGVLDKITTIKNLGNIDIDIDLDVYNDTAGSTMSMDCETGQLPVENVRYNFTKGIDYANKEYVPAVGTNTETNFNLGKQVGATAIDPSNKTVYWGAGIPTSSIGGACSGKILITGLSDS